MDLEVIYTNRDAESQDFSGRITIVVDVLRATTTITAALEAGAECIIPARTVEEARALKANHGDALLCGERHGFAVEGFDYGNSPVELAGAKIDGRTLLLTTTNGTRATIAAGGSVALLAGCVRNAAAVSRAVRRLLSQDTADSRTTGVSIVCSGTDGRYSIDDVYAAGMIVSTLAPSIDDVDDSAHAARIVASVPIERAVNSETCRHVRTLERKGFVDDIAYAFAPDVTDAVPRYVGRAFALSGT